MCEDDGALWWKYYQNKAWYSWQSLGGKLAGGTGPAVASWSAGRLDVFVEGTTGALYHKWYSGATWSGWQNLGGKLTSSPAATSPFTVGVIDVFVRGGDGAVWQKTWNVTAWSSWKSHGGKAAANTGPAVTSFYDLFVQGLNHQLWQTGYYGGRATWSAFNVEPEALSAASPGAVCTDANMHPLVAVSSTSGEIWWGVRDVVGHWDYWYSMGSPP